MVVSTINLSRKKKWNWQNEAEVGVQSSLNAKSFPKKRSKSSRKKEVRFELGVKPFSNVKENEGDMGREMSSNLKLLEQAYQNLKSLEKSEKENSLKARISSNKQPSQQQIKSSILKQSPQNEEDDEEEEKKAHHSIQFTPNLKFLLKMVSLEEGEQSQ